MKTVSTALAGALFGSLEERRANALAACIGRDAQVPKKGTSLTISKQVDLRIVDNDDRAADAALALICRENAPAGEAKPMWPRGGMTAGIGIVVFPVRSEMATASRDTPRLSAARDWSSKTSATVNPIGTWAYSANWVGGSSMIVSVIENLRSSNTAGDADPIR
jgi:hypothetical protein